MLAPALHLAMQWLPLSAAPPLSAALPLPVTSALTKTFERADLPRSAADVQSARAQSGRREVVYQVRIEQRMSIRITAQPSSTATTSIFTVPEAMSRPRIKERKMGRCVANAMIGGMTLRSETQLLFYLRDRRLVSATLERACRARDFYSGFYLVRSSDGKLCVNRDTLQSRSGVNCRINQLRELIANGR